MRPPKFRRAVVAVCAALASVSLLSGCTLATALLTPSSPVADPTPITTTTAPTPTPTPTDAGTPTDFFNLKPGDCFDLTSSETGALLYASCNPPHLYEAFTVYAMPGDATYPGDDAVNEFALTSCADAFTAYVGSTESQSVYTVTWISPNQDTWEGMSDREILCVVMMKDGTQSTGSAKDSRR